MSSLVDIRNYIQHAKMTSLGSLCALFKKEPDTLRGMLSHWIRKGCIRQCPRKPACGSQCFKCPVATVEMYEWVA